MSATQMYPSVMHPSSQLLNFCLLFSLVSVLTISMEEENELLNYLCFPIYLSLLFCCFTFRDANAAAMINWISQFCQWMGTNDGFAEVYK